MSHLGAPQEIILGLIIFAFAALGFTLLGVSLWATFSQPESEPPIQREVTPASRTGREPDAE